MSTFYRILILIALFFEQDSLFKAQSIWFQNSLQPNTTFKVSQRKETKTELLYIMPEENLKLFKEKGISNPTLNSVKEETEMIQRIGNYVNNELHFVSTFTKVVGEKEVFSPGDQIFYTYSNDYGVKVSGTSKEAFPNQKEVFDQLTQALSNSFFKGKKMALNDTLTIISPIQLNFGTFEMDMKIRTIYKLVKIQKNKCTFAVIQSVSATLYIENLVIQLLGKGKGWATYNPQLARITFFEDNMEITFSGNLDKNSKLRGKITTHSIEKNKLLKE